MDEMGWTPVLIAAWTGNKQLVDVLVMAGCDLSVKLDNGNNILHVACIEGNVDIVNYIISNKLVDIESKGMYGRTAVMKAANADQKKVFDFLVSHGCNMSGVDDDGNNTLHFACIGGSVDIAKYILADNIAGIDSKGEHARTPVMTAAAMGQKRVFDLLVSKGCHLSGVDDTGDNLLHLACFRESVDIVQSILTHNIAGVDRKGFNGRTPVMIAAGKGQKRVFDLLVSKGCHMSGVDDTGDNLLHLACVGGSADIVQYILTHNIAGVDSKGFKGRTPVMTAAEKGQKRVFDFLVSRGCNLSGVDVDGYNILHMAAMGGNVGIVKQILTDPTVDINSRVQGNWTPLKFARHEKYDSVIKFLIERGAVDT